MVNVGSVVNLDGSGKTTQFQYDGSGNLTPTDRRAEQHHDLRLRRQQQQAEPDCDAHHQWQSADDHHQLQVRHRN